MKLYLIPLLFLSACATQPAKKVVLINPPGQPVQNTSGLRTPAEIRAYRFGRYADPGDRTVMHEAHPVYRIEKSAAWNLKPADTGSGETTKAATAVERDALLAELNRQRAATKLLTEQAAALLQQSSKLNSTLSQNQKTVEHHQAINRELGEIRSRITNTENQIRTLSPKATPVEEKW